MAGREAKDGLGRNGQKGTVGSAPVWGFVWGFLEKFA